MQNSPEVAAGLCLAGLQLRDTDQRNLDATIGANRRIEELLDERQILELAALTMDGPTCLRG
jgi:hypothetical protein